MYQATSLRQQMLVARVKQHSLNPNFNEMTLGNY